MALIKLTFDSGRVKVFECLPNTALGRRTIACALMNTTEIKRAFTLADLKNVAAALDISQLGAEADLAARIAGYFAKS